MGLETCEKVGGLEIINNSTKEISNYQSFRIDTFFYENIIKTKDFFANDFRWTKLGNFIDVISNGENLATEWYSVDGESNVVYLSVSQINQYGLEDKNISYLKEEILDYDFGKSKRKITTLREDTIIVTRSGTPGIVINTNNSGFNYEEYSYVPSGFLIYFTLKKELKIPVEVITYYLNLQPVKEYLIANSSGRCQRNLSQEVIKNVPIPEELLDKSFQEKIMKLYNDMQCETINKQNEIKKIEVELDELWDKSLDNFENLF